jgi:hypothetical protein
MVLGRLMWHFQANSNVKILIICTIQKPIVMQNDTLLQNAF